ncbi:hypothetical protein [Saccharothrix sp. NRRL B-16314]|uniref:hypothetical protein n=1 Tax=Saccharothrix sp. NRRL B-16314 TaxID=1463825 RepID=UPI0012DEB090|nr:hypothetical protein [Saccharothrix sp. NRRL B-16314]
MLGTAPQEALDAQIVDNADVVVGVFWTRIGTLLPDGTPATVHELERTTDANKPALLYFSNQPVALSSVQDDQFTALKAFKTRAQTWGLYKEYEKVDELVQQIKRDLLRIVRERFELPTPDLSSSPRPPSNPARPVVNVIKERQQRFDPKGRPRIQTSHFLELSNVGGETAEDVRIEWVEPDPKPTDWTPPSIGELEPVDYLVPGAPARFDLLVHMEATSNLVIRITWRDLNGEEHENLQSVRA